MHRTERVARVLVGFGLGTALVLLCAPATRAPEFGEFLPLAVSILPAELLALVLFE